jgi:hypothetical protein
VAAQPAARRILPSQSISAARALCRSSRVYERARRHTASAFNRDYRVDYESRYENKTRLPTKENIQEIIRASDTIHAQGVTLNADNQSIRPSALHRAATCLRRALLGWLWP